MISRSGARARSEERSGSAEDTPSGREVDAAIVAAAGLYVVGGALTATRRAASARARALGDRRRGGSTR